MVMRTASEFGKSDGFGGVAVIRKRFIVVLIFLAGLFAASRQISAHHSAAEFDTTKLISVKGTVTQFEWTNPHAYIYLDVKDDKGEIEKWTSELGSVGMLFRANWRKDSVKPGDQIKFVIASRRDFDWTVGTIRAHALDARFIVLLSSVFSQVAPRAVAEWLLDSQLNVRVQLQLHKCIWEPDARGV